MRYVILGAGAIGGAIGGKLALGGHDVVLVARGAHLEALSSGGLDLRDPDRRDRVAVAAAGSPAEAGIRDGDCVILATKSQQSERALDDLRQAAAESGATRVSVVCAQNGVANEAMALRRFPDVYGMRVILAGTHLEPGVVEIATSPVYGVLDVGRYPTGDDDIARAIAADLEGCGFDARSTGDVMAVKYLKLLSNVGNSLDAACGTRLGSPEARAIFRAAQREARECYDRAGIVVADEEEDEVRRRMRGGVRPVAGAERRGSSSWQSLTRGTGDIEADYLNGEIALLGRLHGVPTPVNVYLQALANRMARRHEAPGSVPIETLAADLAPFLELEPER